MCNQVPSSVSDCLGGQDKEILQILTDGSYSLDTCWQPEGDFAHIDWRSLATAEADGLVNTARFLRVTGTAKADEAAAVATTIARFRSTAKALVITNAVQIEGINDAEDIALSHEQITAFNVRDALRELLTDDENKKIDNLQEVYHAA